MIFLLWILLCIIIITAAVVVVLMRQQKLIMTVAVMGRYQLHLICHICWYRANLREFWWFLYLTCSKGAPSTHPIWSSFIGTSGELAGLPRKIIIKHINCLIAEPMISISQVPMWFWKSHNVTNFGVNDRGVKDPNI
jgi:hypothetical protein